MFLTLERFLDYFPLIQMSRDEFKRSFRITYKNELSLAEIFNPSFFGISSVIKNVDDPRYQNRERIIDYFYEIIIQKRKSYLTAFFRSFLEFPNPYSLKWDGINLKGNDLHSISLQKNDRVRKMIRNLNYLEILHTTRVTNTCKSKTSFWQTLLNVYNHLRLEDRFFCPSSLGLYLRPKKSKNASGINYNNFFYLFQQYQPKASILNPYSINWILKNLFQGEKLLTPVLSWSSNLVAFMHSDWVHYVGIDVIPAVCARTQFVFDYYQQTLKPQLPAKEKERLNRKKIDVYCQPSESLLNDRNYMRQYRDYFDAIFFSPPYFNMEIYEEGDQSLKLYPKYQDWLNHYWKKTIQMCHHVLRPGKLMGIILNNYVSLKKEKYSIIEDTNQITLKFFDLVQVYRLYNRTSPLRVNHKDRTEKLFIFVKK